MRIYNNITISYDPLMMFKVNKIASRNFETIADIFKRDDYFKNGGVHYTKRVVTICINGVWLPFKQWATRLIMPTDFVLVNVMPYAGGSDDSSSASTSSDGGKDFLRIVAQIAVVAAAMVFAPMIAGAMGFVAGTAAYATAQAIASAGIMFIGQLAVNALLPQSTTTSQQETDDIYSLTSQGNRARIGGALPQTYGDIKDFPDFCSKPYAFFDDNEQILIHWMMVTTGDAELSDFKLGDANAGNFADTDIFVFNKNRKYYAADGDGDLILTELSNLSDGDEHHLNNVNIPAHNNVWTAPEVTGGIELIAPNELENGHDGWFGGFAANPPATFLQKFELDFVFPRGLSNNGDVSDDIDVYIDAEYRLIDDHGGSTSVWYNLDSGSSSFTLSGASTDALRYTKTYTTSGLIDWLDKRIEVRVRRISNAATDNDISDQVNWIGLRGFLPNFKYRDDQTIICLKLKAGKEISSLSTRNFNCIAKTKLHALNLTGINDVELAVDTAVTSKPADIIFDALAQMICPAETVLAEKLAKVLTLVDLPTLVRVSEAAIAEGARLDIKVENKKPFWQWLEQFCLCMRVKPYLSGTQISFWRDQERDAPSFGVTPLPVGERARFSLNQFHLVENGMSAKIDFKHVGDLYEGYEIQFLNRETWRADYVRMGVDGEIVVSAGKKPLEINAAGITTIEQARALGQHLARGQEYRNMTVSITTELTGKLIDYGNVLHLPDGIVSEVDSLEIVSHDGDVVVFDADIRNASANKIVFSHKQARATKVIDCVVLDGNSVKLLAAPTIDDVEIDLNPMESGGQYTASLFDEVDGRPIDVIVKRVTPKGDNQMQIDAVIDDARVWA